MLAALGSSGQGLTSSQAAELLERQGGNVLREHRITPAGVLLRQFRNPLLLLLLGCAAISGFTGDPTDAVIIAAIVAVSVLLSFFNEYRAESAVEALHAEIHHRALVCRDGHDQLVDTTTLVVGDVVGLAVGNIVPADLRLLEVDALECDEAVLTGESMPVSKSVDPQPDAAGVDLRSCAFMGTIVHEGAGRGVVVATGLATAFGGIASGLAERATASAFQQGLSRFSTLLVRVAGVLTVTIFIFNVAFHKPLLDALLFSLAIAVGITPELMPAVVTVGLSSGSRALARKRVLVKRLVAIEDLGNIEVLFTDKTGTLTEGAITFDRALAADGDASSTPLLLGLVCNEASVGADGPVGGNTLDQALWASPQGAALSRQIGGPSAYQTAGEGAVRPRAPAGLRPGRRPGREGPRDQRRSRGGLRTLRRRAANGARHPRAPLHGGRSGGGGRDARLFKRHAGAG